MSIKMFKGLTTILSLIFTFYNYIGDIKYLS